MEEHNGHKREVRCDEVWAKNRGVVNQAGTVEQRGVVGVRANKKQEGRLVSEGRGVVTRMKLLTLTR